MIASGKRSVAMSNIDNHAIARIAKGRTTCCQHPTEDLVQTFFQAKISERALLLFLYEKR